MSYSSGRRSCFTKLGANDNTGTICGKLKLNKEVCAQLYTILLYPVLVVRGYKTKGSQEDLLEPRPIRVQVRYILW
jgi:hypothetical protein